MHFASSFLLVSAFLFCLNANTASLFGCSCQDWPSRAAGPTHNPVFESSSRPAAFEPARKGLSKHTKWTAEVGMGIGSEPAVSDGLVWVGGSNRSPRDPNFTGDAGVLFCFRESDGKFLYQHVSPRRKEGRNFDWPSYGVASTPWIEGDRLYYCTNRCETICLNIKPLIDGTGLPTEVWRVDMVDRFGVRPGASHIGSRHLHCSPVVWNDFVYVNTTHTVRPHQLEDIDAEKEPAPSLICFDKLTGKVKWSDNSPGNEMFGPQWNNPTVLRSGGRDQVVMGQGDGWVRAFDCRTGELIWKFDMNEKSARLKLGKDWQSYGCLRQAIPEAVFHQGRLYVAGGQEYEFNKTTGRICCLDPSQVGDISSELLLGESEIATNPNSGLIWQFAGSKSGPEGWQTDKDAINVMHGSLGSVAISEGLLVANDLQGVIHCLDEKTGERLWSYDTLAPIWGTPLIMKDKIVTCNEDGMIYIIPLSRTLDQELIEQHDATITLQCSPIFANETFYFNSLSTLFAVPAAKDAGK